MPNFSLPFELETNASNITIGAVLMQQNHPTAFFSKKMSTKMCKLYICKRVICIHYSCGQLDTLFIGEDICYQNIS